MKKIQCQHFTFKRSLLDRKLIGLTFLIPIILKEGVENILRIIQFCINYLLHPFGDKKIQLRNRYIVFLLLSIPLSFILVFLIEKFEGYILLSFIILLFIDQKISKESIHKEKTLFYVNGKVDEIFILPITLKSRFCSIKLFEAWKIVIQYSDRENKNYYESIYEAKNINDVYSKAMSLGKDFSAPIRFKDGEFKDPKIQISGGFEDFSGEQSQLKNEIFKSLKNSKYKRLSNSLPVVKENGFVKIESRWVYGNYIIMTGTLSKVIAKSLILVVVINLLTIFGEILSTPTGLETTEILQDSLSSIVPFFNGFWQSNVYDLVEIGVIASLFMSKSMDFRMRELFCFDAKKFNFYLKYNFSSKNSRCASLSTLDIKHIVYIEEPVPQIIIADSKNALNVEGLQTEFEFKMIIARILEGFEFIGAGAK